MHCVWYVLAGWYKAKQDVVQDGEVVGYEFKAEDRWDFAFDRVTEDITLYARWIPQAVVQYIDVDTDEVLFDQNITGDSPVQELSSAVMTLIKPSGTTFLGYFTDKTLTSKYDFWQIYT